MDCLSPLPSQERDWILNDPASVLSEFAAGPGRNLLPQPNLHPFESFRNSDLLHFWPAFARACSRLSEGNSGT